MTLLKRGYKKSHFESALSCFLKINPLLSHPSLLICLLLKVGTLLSHLVTSSLFELFVHLYHCPSGSRIFNEAISNKMKNLIFGNERAFNLSGTKAFENRTKGLTTQVECMGGHNTSSFC